VIAVIVLSVLAVVGVGVFSAVRMVGTMKEVLGTSDAGPPMSDAEISALLAGPKRDFVGEWKSPTGSLVIRPDGRAGYAMRVGFANESANGRIVVFRDDAFYIMSFRFSIDEPPHRDGARWKMRVRGNYFERDEPGR
jgi:hypothetical protein